MVDEEGESALRPRQSVSGELLCIHQAKGGWQILRYEARTQSRGVTRRWCDKKAFRYCGLRSAIGVHFGVHRIWLAMAASITDVSRHQKLVRGLWLLAKSIERGFGAFGLRRLQVRDWTAFEICRGITILHISFSSPLELQPPVQKSF